MKALASAEKEKKENQEKVQLQQASNTQVVSAELSLAPKEEVNDASLDADAFSEQVLPQKNEQNEQSQQNQKKNISFEKATENQRNQKAVANVFSAAQLPKSYFNQALLALALMTIGLMVWLGSELIPYQQTQQTIQQPTFPQNSSVNASGHTINPAINLSNVKQAVDQEKPLNHAMIDESPKVSTPPKISIEKLTPKKSELPVKTAAIKTVEIEKNNLQQPVELAQSEKNPLPEKTEIVKAQPQALNLISQKSTLSIDPTLLSAYQAFNQGQFPQAQQQYRQVLQKDVRNIDALLGMAAIAEKQGRMADAVGWYQKVLEIEPNHTLASTAIFNMQTQTDATSQISRLKNLIAQQPENASLHAALGNAYAQQNDWLSAQAAYFEATRFAPVNAEYAFNVAVSLEHLGKPALALLQYQRALMLVQQSGALSPDQQVLKARISALQPSS